MFYLPILLILSLYPHPPLYVPKIKVINILYSKKNVLSYVYIDVLKLLMSKRASNKRRKIMSLTLIFLYKVIEFFRT